jgi:hypothetical protein
MKQSLIIVAALAAGFVGGILGTLVTRTSEQSSTQQLVRARSFELVNGAGEAISYWGVDKSQNAVIAFGNRGLPGGVVLPGRPPLDLKDPDNQLASIGLQGNDMPVLKMRGADMKTRVRLLLSMYGKPFLLMEDESGPRVSLGIEQSDTPGPEDNDWSLAFYPERARIGMYTEKVGGQTYVRGGFAVHRDKVKYPSTQLR